MGRKSAAKSQHASSTAGTPPPSEPGRSSTPLLATGIVLVLAIAGLVAYTRSSQPAPAAEVAQAAPPAVVDPPAAAKLGPHPQATLPPLPFQAYAPPRPMETVKAVYRFAAELLDVTVEQLALEVEANFLRLFGGLERAERGTAGP